MDYYAIQVKTGEEDEYIRRASRIGILAGRRFFVPRRKVIQRKAGKDSSHLLAVFPGYLFYETVSLGEEERWALRRIEGFYRFLPSSISPSPLDDKDRTILLHFISFGDFADISKVSFDEADRIVVLEGPLKGLEGSIVKVDKRRGRAKVSLDICSTGFLVDFGFRTVEKLARGGAESHEGQ
jgi:transcriptional antiterminator NusG